MVHMMLFSLHLIICINFPSKFYILKEPVSARQTHIFDTKNLKTVTCFSFSWKHRQAVGYKLSCESILYNSVSKLKHTIYIVIFVDHFEISVPNITCIAFYKILYRLMMA